MMSEWSRWRRAVEWSGDVEWRVTLQVAWKRRRRHNATARAARGRHCRGVRAAEADGGGVGERGGRGLATA